MEIPLPVPSPRGTEARLLAAVPRLAPLLRPRLTEFIPHAPTARQAAFLLLDHEEAMFGGAAGGGKSDALLMAALQYVDVPGYAALLLRRSYTDLSLPGALMDRAQQWLAGTSARWNGTEKRWTFPSGASMTFGYLEHEGDEYRYQGPEFQFVGFDELTQFTEPQYRYLFSRLRRLASSDVPIRMRSASNPGGLGHEWVRARFIDSRAPGRLFVPSKLVDNPHLDREEYVRSLNHLDPVTRRQLLEGDWTARSGGSLFRREWFEVVDAAPANIMGRVRAWDLAASVSAGAKRTAGVRLSRTNDGLYFVEHVVLGQWVPGDRDRVVHGTAKTDGAGCRVLIEQEPGSGGLAQIDALKRLLQGHRVDGIKVTGDKVVRAGPVASQADVRNVRVVRGDWNFRFFDELEAFPEGAMADQVDALSLAYNQLSTYGPVVVDVTAAIAAAERFNAMNRRLFPMPPYRLF